MKKFETIATIVLGILFNISLIFFPKAELSVIIGCNLAFYLVILEYSTDN